MAHYRMIYSSFLLLMILALSSLTGCIQNDLYAGQYAAPAQETPKEGVDMFAGASLRMEIDFQPEVSRTLFHTRGTFTLQANTSLPYVILNASLWREGVMVEKVKYMLIQVEPGKNYSFDISRNLRIPKGDYDCVLEAESPSGSIFSEKQRCLFIDEPASQDKAGSYNQEPVSLGRQEDLAVEQDRYGLQDPVAEKIAATYSSAGALNAEERTATTPAASSGNGSQVDSSQDMLVGSSGSNKYHRLDCRFVAKIKNKIYFTDSQEAQKKGREPCKVCNPA